MDEEDAPEILCEPSFWYGVVGLEPFVIMNLECTTYMGEEIGVVTERPDQPVKVLVCNFVSVSTVQHLQDPMAAGTFVSQQG